LSRNKEIILQTEGMDIDGGEKEEDELPQLTAQTAAAFEEDLTRLEEDEGYENKMWGNIYDAMRARDLVDEELQTLAKSLGLAVQRIVVRQREATVSINEALDKLNVQRQKVRVNTDAVYTQTKLILMQRPSQMALFDGPAKVPVDTPTLGPRLTDEIALLERCALDVTLL